MKLKSYLSYLFIIFVFGVQFFDFTMDLLDAFQIEVGIYALDTLALIVSMFLTFLLFDDFLKEEYRLDSTSVYIIIGIFVLSNVNILLKFLLPEKVLYTYRNYLNLIPIFLIFLVLPLYIYIKYKNIKKPLLLVIFSVIAVYPISQLYTFVVDKFVALMATFYLLYALFESLKDYKISLEELGEHLFDFDETLIRNYILKPSKKADKIMFYFYFLLLFYFISDFALFIIPSVTGFWTASEYLKYMGIHVQQVSLSPLQLISVFSLLIIVAYPIMELEFPKIKEKKEILIVLYLLLLGFLLKPSIYFQPILFSKEAYGVILGIFSYKSQPMLSLVAIALAGALSIFLLFPKVKKNALQMILKTGGTSILLTYSALYSFSLYVSIRRYYINSIYLLIVGGLLLFFIFSTIYLAYSLAKGFSEASWGELVSLLYMGIILLSYVPSAYTLSFFILSAIVSSLSYVLRREPKMIPLIILISYLVSLKYFENYIPFVLLFLWAYAVATEFKRKPSLNLSPLYIPGLSALIVILYTFLGYYIGEVIPVELSLLGVVYLLGLSGAEEIVFKRIIYDNLDFRYSLFLVSLLFTFTHLLSPVVFYHYLHAGVLLVYLFYLFTYQYLTLMLYRESRLLELLIVVHFLINLGVLLLTT